MGAQNLGRLEKVELREIWANEASDFTQWLAQPENMQLLGETIGIEIADARTEFPVGSYRVDILARDAVTDRSIVIENQLEATNHDHLGKVVTYAAGLDAESVVWIVREARDEHQKAIEWLNDHTIQEVNFFLIEARAWKIGNSDPAPEFEIVVRPNDWFRQQRQTLSEANSDFDPEIQTFYQRVREYGVSNAKSINRWRPAPGKRWYDILIGSTQAHLVLRVTKQQNQVSVELYITDNKELFSALIDQRDVIEAELGLNLQWKESPGKKSSRLIAVHEGYFADRSRAQELVVWLVETADLFARVFPKYL